MKSLKEIENQLPVREKVNSFLDWAGISELVSYSSVMKHILFLFFIVLIAIFHIANTHYAERTIRKIAKKEKEVKELKWEYTTIMSELMYNSKQSKVAQNLKETGLQESIISPKKIVKQKREY
jgi:cell division protein FtsL